MAAHTAAAAAAAGSAAPRFVAGAMSGTSADGVDVAIVEIAGRGADMSARLVRHHHRPYTADLREQIFTFRGGGGGGSANNSVTQDTLARLARMGREISLTYATAVNEALAAAHMNANDLAAVAAHGQTLYHDPPNTIQWLDPSLLAAEVGCAVVSDFRRADLAAGGQGAPLVPFADYILFRHPTKHRVLLNLGGIANITCLQAGGDIARVVAYDTGPANCISDHLCRQLDPTGPGHDVQGARASRGQRIVPMLERMSRARYFARTFPKSTDGPEMIAIFESARAEFAAQAPLDDLLATAAALTASTIAKEVNFFRPDELVVSGGGTCNSTVMSLLRVLIPTSVRTTDELGLPSEAKEALAFALLAAATLDGVGSNVPSVTGAKRPVILGSITPRP